MINCKQRYQINLILTPLIQRDIIDGPPFFLIFLFFVQHEMEKYLIIVYARFKYFTLY